MNVTINVFMNRDNLLRSRPSFPYCFFQTLLPAVGVSLIACPVWGLPLELVPYSAIDLIEARHQVEGVDSDHESEPAPATALNAQPAAFKPETQTLQQPDRNSTQSAQNIPTPNPQNSTPTAPPPIDLDPELIKNSPVLQRWLKQVPNVLTDIKRDPSFRTRLRLGYSQFPSSKQAGGLHIGIEDVFVGRSGLTLSADYQTAFNSTRNAWGADLRYYVRPLGSVINIAPVIGYRHLKTTRYSTDGAHVGLRLLLVPSRIGAADLALTQSWVAPGGEDEVGLTTLSFGYALTPKLRLATDLQKQNSRFRSDSRIGVGLEWMF